ncbi:MAG: GNAT family N-acetyltransferase [Ignavibacteria bacterium]|nr:GNAT family N-acetyltransferase [Ignavibacteria bacterium]
MNTFQSAVRNIEIADLSRVLEINNANTPGVSELTIAELAQDLDNSLHALVIDNELGEVCAFCITFGPDGTNAGINHRWFADRYKSFVYLDRIAIDSNYQNRGLGEVLYQSVEQQMLDSSEHSLLCCEVNLEPPNPGSLRFHQRIGFSEVGRHSPEQGYVVSMLQKVILDR